MPDVASLVARDLILAARDEHPAFAEGRRHPSPVLLRRLSRYQRELASKLIRLRPSALVAVLETALPLADFDLGIELPDYKYPAACEAIETDGTERPVDLVSWQSRLQWVRAAYLRSGFLYLTGIAADWSGFTQINFSYVPELEALTGLNDVLIVPNAAEACLVADLSYFMARRGQKDPDVEPPDTAAFAAAWSAAEEHFLNEQGRHTQAQSSIVRETF